MERIEYCDQCANQMEWQTADATADNQPPRAWQYADLYYCRACNEWWWYQRSASTPNPSYRATEDSTVWIQQYPRLHPKTRDLWLAIKQEFEEQSPPMTVRQMFYRMSVKHMVDKTENGYRQVQRALAEMRRAGAIPYHWLSDNTRWVRKAQTYSGLADMLENSLILYRRDLWQNQTDYIEIWLEKEALAGVVHEVTDPYGVPLYVTRGYPSITYLYEAAETLKGIHKHKVIYHFGDFDASGQDAARAIRDGLRQHGSQFEFIQYAVTEKQIDSLSLETRPAKGSDPRAARHGELAVELDAIPPAELRFMIKELIEAHINPYQLDMHRREEAAEREMLRTLINHHRHEF